MNDETINRKVIAFQLGNETYAVTVQQVKFIEHLLPVTRVPHTPDFVKGVINLRGIVTPVIDLRNRFGMPETELTDKGRMIIAFLDDMEVGMIVDGVSDVLNIPESAIEPPLETSSPTSADYIEGIANVDERLIILLRLEKVLSAAHTRMT